MLKLADLITENSEKLSKLETLAMGQPIVLGKRVLAGVSVIWRCELAYLDRLIPAN